ncbi:DUF6482 family protein [Pseudoalteromonas aurantia]|uniref:Uncharacterized protein n=1 Tax=Pseudoalteromonas aurantia TaxID=43654 RepID=A0A5S3V9L6_9GAMM|nr:DUF6482 family protein [Pseudoalteromonas aurantia]TMO68588.1 hypothetical protein CWC19_08920 [Pseudoalteromonas aurantia]
MQSAQLKNHFKQHELNAVILSYADSSHYLAGGVDDNGDYHLLVDKKGNTMTFKSLREAEMQLIELGATKAILDMETAYDEMVGAATTGHGKIELTLSH